jgi:hypothetical protein
MQAQCASLIAPYELAALQNYWVMEFWLDCPKAGPMTGFDGPIQ